jgi:hypothetical protein
MLWAGLSPAGIVAHVEPALIVAVVDNWPRNVTVLPVSRAAHAYESLGLWFTFVPNDTPTQPVSCRPSTMFQFTPSND